MQPGADMIVILGAVGGAIAGAVTARMRQGNAADMAQYAAGYGILCAVLGLVVTIVIARMA